MIGSVDRVRRNFLLFCVNFFFFFFLCESVDENVSVSATDRFVDTELCEVHGIRRLRPRFLACRVLSDPVLVLYFDRKFT